MKMYAWLCGMAFCSATPVMAVPQADNPLPGRLFYTPAQRVMLNNARSHQVTEPQNSFAASEPAPVSFDGFLRRSDGVTTHWINGRPHVGQPAANVRSLKPGQTRAHQKVYESYQLLRPMPSSSVPRTQPATDNEATP